MAELVRTRRTRTKKATIDLEGEIPEAMTAEEIEAWRQCGGRAGPEAGENEGVRGETGEEREEIPRQEEESQEKGEVLMSQEEEGDSREEVEDGTRKIDFERLYPSITQSLWTDEETAVEPPDELEKNSLDVVRDRIVEPEAPVEEWTLPEPMRADELCRLYENGFVEGLERVRAEGVRDMRERREDRLWELVDAYQRGVRAQAGAEQRVEALRAEMERRERELWSCSEKTGGREARCRDNALVKRAYRWDEAALDVAGARWLEERAGELVGDAAEELTARRYEAGLRRATVEQYLAAVEAAPAASGLAGVREAVGTLLRAVRAPPLHAGAVPVLRQWVASAGGVLVARGAPGDRLWLLWQLLHCPPGVGRWGAGLVQPGRHSAPQVAVAMLALLLGPGHRRELLLGAWNPPGTAAEDAEWAVVDSDGEEDAGGDRAWALLRESDVLAFLNQIPLGAVFQDAAGLRDSRDRYEPERGCSPEHLLRLMAFCLTVAQILDHGLDQYCHARYKALNRRLSRLLKHTIQFLTDHLESVLSRSVLPEYQHLFVNNVQMQMLAQYELIYECVLKSLLKHRRHGNWQCLTDLPWRMLSPRCKWLFFTFIIDYNQKTIPENNDWWLTNIQLIIDPLTEGDTIYLLTVLSNLAIESRPCVATEMVLLSTITKLLFQICYVIPATRSSFSKVGRELISSICLQHPQALSIIIDSMKLWHPSVGQMGLFLFRDLPFCLMMPSDSEFRLLSSWVLENPPNSICNQLARYIFTNLNWGFSNPDETLLYLPLSLHQRMATLLITSFKKHTVDGRSSNWLISESIKLVTNLWWYQEGIQDQSFHSWCLGLSIRLRLHPSTRYKVFEEACLQPSSVTNTSEWLTALSDAFQDRCNNPIAMYVAVTTAKEQQSLEDNQFKVIYNLVFRHQQYRMGLELLSQIIMCLSSIQTTILLNNDMFINLWKLIIHADDTYYNMVKNLISKQFPGPVLGCIGNSFCPSLIIGNGDKDRQETVMKFFLHSILDQQNWFTDQSFLWLLDKLLELDVALDLKTGSEVFYMMVKDFTNKQFSDATKRSGFAQIFRLGCTFTPLLNQLGSGEYMWLKSYLLEAEALVENDIGLWKEFLNKLLVRKKKEPRTVTGAMNSACKHLRLGLSFNVNSLVIIQSVQVLGACPPEHLAIIKIATVFFQRYLGLAGVWNRELTGLGSVGHKIFEDDLCHPFLLQARASITACKNHHLSQLDSLKQSNPENVLLLDQMQQLYDKLEMLLLWIDEPRLHLEDVSISGLPGQYRPDLLNLVRQSSINTDTFNLPKRTLLEQLRKSGSQWNTRHDLDLRFVRLVNSMLNKKVVPLDTKLLLRFKRQLSAPTIPEMIPAPYSCVIIPPEAVKNTTQVLEFISGPLSIMYQSAAKHKANKNFLTDLNKRFFTSLPKHYEQQTVNQTVQVPCSKGAQYCSGQATINLNYQTWVKRNDIVGEATRNRQDFNKLIDEMIQFSNLDQLVNGVVVIHHLIMKLDSLLQSTGNQEEFKKIVDCGLALFFYLGRQINPETQQYPPHHSFVSETMELIGSKFMQYSFNQASVLLKGMLENELLVELYSPHFCPNVDTSATASMYTETVDCYQANKCSQMVACAILSKFSIKQFLESTPSFTSKLNMVDSLCNSISFAKLDRNAQVEIDGKMEEMHVNNLVALLTSSFSLCLPRVLERFRSLSDLDKLAARFWAIGSSVIQTNIEENKELVLSIEEIRLELETMSVWLNKCRFSDAASKKYGIYVKHGASAAEIINICSMMLDSLGFKLGRSAKENIVSWHEVVEKVWDLFLKIYIPWLQAFSVADSGSQPMLNVPWRSEDQNIATTVMRLAVEQLNTILIHITNKDAQSYLLHCVLIWIANGLLLIKELSVKPYHETYCDQIKALKWQYLNPSVDCVKLITEFVSRQWASEQCKSLFIDITSQMEWAAGSLVLDVELICNMFELTVAVVCRCKTAFKIAATEKLTDIFIELDWSKLEALIYRKGMEQVVANLEPRIILCNPSTIEGKIIRLLNHAAGSATLCDLDELYLVDIAIEKQTIYVSSVVKLLSVAFSFTQNKSKNKVSGDDSQVKLFQLRISDLFSEIESITLKVKRREFSEKMAICVLTEVVQLFKNQSIAGLAIDPAIEWLQESRDSPLILPFLIILFQCSTHVSAQVRLAEELIETYIFSDKSDGGHASWATITSCVRLDPTLQHQYWKECVKQGSFLCLVQQVLASLPSAMVPSNTESWQARIVEWLEQVRPQKQTCEQSAVLLVFFYLELLISASKISTKPSASFKNMIQLLLKLSESKTSSGFLGKVGLGKKSGFSFEFRMLCRSMSVFLHVQLPTSNVLRVHPNDPGAVTHPDMVIPTRSMGEPLPTNKTLQNLDWLKSQRSSKELTPVTKTVLESNIAYICQPQHSVSDCSSFLRSMCRQLWPDNKLFNLIH